MAFVSLRHLEMADIRTYKDLEAWQVAMDLVKRCYEATAVFPRSEQYGLTSQLRRAAVSIPSNIAEGQCRRKIRTYANHVNIAIGSHGELETCIEISRRLGFLSPGAASTLQPICDSTGRLLNGLYRSLELRLAEDQSR